MSNVPCETKVRPILQGFSKKKNAIYLYQPRCKQWSCKPCAQANIWDWSALVVNGVNHYAGEGVDNWNFITITSHKKNRTFSQTVWCWPRSWKKLSSRMRYHFPGIRYVLIPEQHEDNRLHVHALVSDAVTTAWLKKHAPSCGLGYMNDGKPLEMVWYAARYVTKYLSKTLGVLNWPKKFRRIRTSQRWPKLPIEDWQDPESIQWHYRSTSDSDKLETIADSIRGLSEFDVIVL